MAYGWMGLSKTALADLFALVVAGTTHCTNKGTYTRCHVTFIPEVSEPFKSPRNGENDEELIQLVVNSAGGNAACALLWRCPRS